MSRCTKFAGNADGITWECTRERDHDGPCAMALLMIEQCGAERRWLAADSLTVYADAACVLARGHVGDHRGEIGWPS